MARIKKALVTGAAGGIGSEICVRLALKGVSLVVCDINQAGLDVLVGKLGSNPVDTFVADVVDHEGLEKTLLEVAAKHPDIDLLVLNAGIDKPQRAEKFDWRLGKLHFDINTTANYVFLSVFIPRFIKQGGGHVTTLISLGGLLGCPYEHAYNGSKAALRMIIDGYRAELVDRNITFTSVLPGYIKTAMAVDNAFEIKSYMTVEYAAEKIVNGTMQRVPYLKFPFMSWLQIALLNLLPLGLRHKMLRKEMDQEF